MVSKASDDLPEPESPVKTTRESRGISRSTLRRLCTRAPRTLIETTRNFSNSKIARDFLGDTFVEHFAATRDWEWRQWLDGVTDWELKRYLEII